MSEFARLLEKQIPPPRRYARALTRSTGGADDLVQSCLARALAKEHLWQARTDLRVWLFTILHNIHVGNLRRSMREQDRAEAAIASLALAQPTPAARLELLDLDRAIAKLPEYHRQVILLLGLEGMRYRQAAAILGVPVGTVRSRIARARQSLRELMDGEERMATTCDERHPCVRLPSPPQQRESRQPALRLA
jgi:RNA polymerase sigma-70 factor, ECF subfamily